ncbi:MAG TPA: DUF6048 family protein [Chitinophaga sp.]
MLLCLLMAVAVHAQVNRSQYKPPVSLDSSKRKQQLPPRDTAPVTVTDTAKRKLPADTTHRAALRDTTRRTGPARDTLRNKKPALTAADSMVLVPAGLRIGLDISRFVVKYFQPYRTDINIAADLRWKPDLYLAMEAGFNSTAHSDSNYTYKGRGEFISIGVDKNFLKRNNPFEKHMFYGGARYGFAHMSYEIPAYTIYNTYWSANGGNIQGSYPRTSANVHWIELVLGFKAEILQNFFLGWSIHERIMINNVAGSAFPPLVIPGYGTGNKKSQFDMQYTISYVIPLYKIAVPKFPKKKPEKKKEIPRR